MCSANEFRCATTGACVPLFMHCDGVAQCADLSDEMNCPKVFKCWTTHQCIPLDNKCDGVKHCLDGSDELECFWRP